MKQKNRIEKYSCKLVKEEANLHYFAEETQISNSSQAADVIRRLSEMDKSPSEQFWVFFFNAKMQLTGYSMVSSGGLSSTPAECRDIFRAAILSNAASVIAAHNHPSGDSTPSDIDTELTRKIFDAGKILGISVLDHIILGDNNDYFSFRESGLVAL